jgi:hypothetical protein
VIHMVGGFRATLRSLILVTCSMLNVGHIQHNEIGSKTISYSSSCGE